MNPEQTTTPVIALQHQIKFVRSEALHTGLVAGFGAGKSKAATIKVLQKKMKYPSIDVAYYLPTYGLIKSIAFGNFNELLEQAGIPFTLNRSDYEYTTPFGKIIMRSMMNPEMIIGYEVGYSLVDEADVLPKKKMEAVFKQILARNRKKLPNGDRNSVDAVSTPEGFKWMYEYFKKSTSKNRVLIHAKTSDNPYLPKTYVADLMETYTEEEIQAYLNGEFVNLNSGTVHHTFDRLLNHSDRTIKAGEVLHVGMDFNVTNMSAVIHVIDASDNQSIKRHPIAVDEITKAYDTPDMIRLLQNRFEGHKIVVYPDASGKNRKTSASSTDIDLLKQARFTVRSPNKNPAVRDRVTVMNSLFKNANGDRTALVNTNNCPEYTECLERLPYKNGEPDKTSGFDHLCEAGGYFLYQQKTKKPTRISV